MILRGLGEHWGEVDDSLNPDLDDIGAAYSPGYFVVAWAGSALAGTGGMLPHLQSEHTVQIHRMSVATEHRRQGLGSSILTHLLDTARARGFRRVVLETTETWTEVISFYERHCFRPFERRDGDLYLSLKLGRH
ncbi:MAG: GNAT family N-acetyltransferase [Myxococcota bacterium]